MTGLSPSGHPDTRHCYHHCRSYHLEDHQGGHQEDQQVSWQGSQQENWQGCQQGSQWALGCVRDGMGVAMRVVAFQGDIVNIDG